MLVTAPTPLAELDSNIALTPAPKLPSPAAISTPTSCNPKFSKVLPADSVINSDAPVNPIVDVILATVDFSTLDTGFTITCPIKASPTP